MEDVGKLIIDIEPRLAGLEAQVKKAEQNMASTAQRIEKNFSGSSLRFNDMLAKKSITEIEALASRLRAKLQEKIEMGAPLGQLEILRNSLAKCEEAVVNFKRSAEPKEEAKGGIFSRLFGGDSALGSMVKWVSGLYAAKKVLDYLKESVEEFAKVEEMRNYFQGTTEDIELFKKATSNTVKQGDLIRLSNQATDLGVSIKKQPILFLLAKNAAEAYGTSTEEGFQKVTMASEGNVKALKSLGIQKGIFNEFVKEGAKAHGDSINNLDAETQKQIRLEAILKASGLTMDDVKNKQKSLADSIESLSVHFDNLKLSIGEAVGQAIRPYLDAADEMATKSENSSSGMNLLTGFIKVMTIAGASLFEVILGLGFAFGMMGSTFAAVIKNAGHPGKLFDDLKSQIINFNKAWHEKIDPINKGIQGNLINFDGKKEKNTEEWLKKVNEAQKELYKTRSKKVDDGGGSDSKGSATDKISALSKKLEAEKASWSDQIKAWNELLLNIANPKSLDYIKDSSKRVDAANDIKIKLSKIDEEMVNSSLASEKRQIDAMIEGIDKKIAANDLWYKEQKNIIEKSVKDEKTRKDELDKLNDEYFKKAANILDEEHQKEIDFEKNYISEVMSLEKGLLDTRIQNHELSISLYAEYLDRQLRLEIDALEQKNEKIKEWNAAHPKDQKALLDVSGYAANGIQENSSKVSAYASGQSESNTTKFKKDHPVAVDNAKRAQDVIKSGFDSMYDQIEERGRLADLRLSTVFNSMAKSFARSIAQMIEQWIEFQLLVNGLNLISPNLGTNLGKALGIVNPFGGTDSTPTPAGLTGPVKRTASGNLEGGLKDIQTAVQALNVNLITGNSGTGKLKIAVDGTIQGRDIYLTNKKAAEFKSRFN